MTAAGHAGLKDLHIHDLRHVFASKMVMNDINEYSPACFEKACLFRRGEYEVYVALYYRGASWTQDIYSSACIKKHCFLAEEYEMTKRYSHLVPDTLKKAVDYVWNINFKRS